jgi:hypothetical protein
MTKDKELELAPTALNPIIGIEIIDESVMADDVTTQSNEE